MSTKRNRITNWLILEDDHHRKTSSMTKTKKRKSQLRESNELIESPISGTFIIKDWKTSKTQFHFTKAEEELNKIAVNFVQITPQARTKLEKIPNNIGPYECKLCKTVYRDAFELALHNCPRVVHIEYNCSECGKQFGCPANLASHKRWHRPRDLKGNLIDSEEISNEQKGSVTPKSNVWNPFLNNKPVKDLLNVTESNLAVDRDPRLSQFYIEIKNNMKNAQC